jgi:hypothetical protein
LRNDAKGFPSVTAVSASVYALKEVSFGSSEGFVAVRLLVNAERAREGLHLDRNI